MRLSFSSNVSNVKDSTVQGVASQEFLVFTLGKKEFAIRLVKVLGLSGYESVTPIRDAYESLVGVIHSDGVTVPIIDLRFQFEPGKPSYDPNTNLLMLQIADRVVGMAVNSIAGTTTLAAEQISLVPELTETYEADYLIGIARIDQREIYLIDIDRLMSHIKLWFMEKAAA